MRKGRRRVGLIGAMALLGAVVGAAPREGPKTEAPIRMTVEVNWNLPAAAVAGALGPVIVLELTDGQILGAAVVRPDDRLEPIEPAPGEGPWRVGSSTSGRVRARLEAPMGSSLIVRAGGQQIRVPLVALLEGPQRTAAQAPVQIGVERLPWDTLEVRLGEGDGTAAPGPPVTVQLAANILTPEPTEVRARLVAELRPLRGEELIWRQEFSQTVTTNTTEPPSRALTVPLPRIEGTYVLELRSTWEPVSVAEGSRLGRWLRRRRNAGGAASSTSTRRVTLAVVGPTPAPAAVPERAELASDVVDLSRRLGHRLSASGRSPVLARGDSAWAVPAAALVEPYRRDRLRGWISRTDAELAELGPVNDQGLDWSALSLKATHPGRPHRLTVTVVGGHPSALGVALVVPGGSNRKPRVLLDACASGLPILETGPPLAFSWTVWPDAEEPVLVLLNRSESASVRIGAVELMELTELAPAPAVATVPAGSARTLGLYLAGPRDLDRFGGAQGAGLSDPLRLARNLVSYLDSLGATAAVLPERLADREGRAALEGQGVEDAIGPDALDLVLRILDRQGFSAWLEVDPEGPLPGLPAPGTPEASARGLVRVDCRGLPDGPVYHPLNPEVQAALKRRLVAAIAPRRARPNLKGLLIRLGRGPTLLGGPDTGFDDATFHQFLRATGLESAAREVPGLLDSGPGRFAARSQFLSGAGRMPWLTWRARAIGTLYAVLTRAVAQAAPGAVLAVVTPALDEGPASDEARRADLAGLPPNQAWRAVGLDLEHWPTGDEGPIVLRGVALSPDDLMHDLAISPELDAEVAAQPSRGLLLDVTSRTPSRFGPYLPELSAPGDDSKTPEERADALNLKWEISNLKLEEGPSRAATRLPFGKASTEPDPSALVLRTVPAAEGASVEDLLGHALAAMDARWVFVAGSAVAGQEEAIRRFGAVFRALPGPAAPGPPAKRSDSGVVVRTIEAGSKTYLALANDTPYPTRLATIFQAPASARVEDLGRGFALAPAATADGRQLVLDLAPFGVAAIRVAAPAVRVTSITPYHPAAVLASMEARKAELSRSYARLSRLARAGNAGPPNPGFEPDIELAGVEHSNRPRGWHLASAGAVGNAVVIDNAQPHSGQGSLRLDAPSPPAAALSDPFTPPDGPTLTLHTWLRADRPDTPVRVRFEGNQAGQPFSYQADLTVQPTWQSVLVPIRDLPVGGLDQARLRFELSAGGRLWLDDLALSGSRLSEPERRNTRRTLLAALQAYREKRYADFTRLASSHWARRVDPSAAELEPDRTGLRTDDASALPAGRRLR
jgi:hypothetical protein